MINSSDSLVYLHTSTVYNQLSTCSWCRD